MTTPSGFARITADTLDTGAIKQITSFFAGTLKADQMGSPNLTRIERATLSRAADDLTTILSWQTPKGVS